MPRQPWFIDAFTNDYLEVYSHRDEASAAREAKAALSLLRHDPRRGLMLELAAGAGRHAKALRGLRCRLVCLDLSADLTRRSADAGLATVRADMRRLPFQDWSFRAITCLFSSFGYFAEEGEHLETMREMARVLEPGGGALLDLMDRDTVEYHLVPQSVDIVGEMVIEVERALVNGGERVEKSIRVLRQGDRKVQRAWTESVRLFTSEELSDMAARSRLVIENTCGDYDGRPVVPGETRRLIVLRKPKE